MSWTPTMNWRTPPHNTRARKLRTETGEWIVRPEGAGSNRFRAFEVRGEEKTRTEMYGVGLHYVMALVESEARRRSSPRVTGKQITVLLLLAARLLTQHPPADRGLEINALIGGAHADEDAKHAASAFVDVLLSRRDEEENFEEEQMT